MKFLEKNNHIVRLKSESHFYADYKLFNNYFPSHQLNRELEKANQFNRARLDGQMIMLLLDKVSPETIVKFREEYSPNESTGSNIKYDPDAITSIDEAKELIKNSKSERIEINRQRKEVLELQRELNHLETIKEEKLSSSNLYIHNIKFRWK